MLNSTNSSFGLYLHIPYCIKKCPYCDFNSHPVGEKLSQATEQGYLAAIIAELKLHLPDWRNRVCNSVYFGGGTPSIFAPESIQILLNNIRTLLLVTAQSEITLEANPGTLPDGVALDRLSRYREAGVNRISLGCQSFSNQKLKTLGRIHCAEDSIRSIQDIRDAGFANYNFDLIFGVIGETVADWHTELTTAISFNPPHLSVYGLTINQNSAWYLAHQQGHRFDAPESLQAEMFNAAHSTLIKAGYEHYEISNYAQPTRHSKHNLNYWSGGDYLGLGAGAHSFFASQIKDANSNYGQRWCNVNNPLEYIQLVTAGKKPIVHRETLSREQARLEYLMLRLRCQAGFIIPDYEHRFGQSFSSREQQIVRAWQHRGLANLDLDSVRLTSKGFLFSDKLIEELA